MGLPEKTWNRSGKSYSTARLQRWEEVAMLSFIGKRNNEIAEILDYTESRVSIIIHAPVVQEMLRKWRESKEANAVDIMAEFRKMLTDNLNIPKEILESDETSMALKEKVYFQLADRLGYGAIKKIDQRTTHQLTSKDLLKIKRRAEGFSDEDIEDAEVIEIGVEVSELEEIN